MSDALAHEGLLTIEEIRSALKKINHNQILGFRGNSLNIYETVITCIPKENKAQEYLNKLVSYFTLTVPYKNIYNLCSNLILLY